MELLYLIDRTLTTFLQRLAQIAEDKFGLDRDKQETLITLAIVASLIIRYWELFDKNYFLFILRIFLSFPLIIPGFIAAIILSVLLEVLQGFFDPTLDPEEKLYDNGYIAWSCLLVAVSYLIWSFKAFDFLAMSVHTAGLIVLMIAIDEFIDREKKDGQKKAKAFINEAFQKILEKCRSWLPVPVPSS